MADAVHSVSVFCCALAQDRWFCTSTLQSTPYCTYTARLFLAWEVWQHLCGKEFVAALEVHNQQPPAASEALAV